MHTDDKQTAGDKRIAPSASSQRLRGQFFRVLRLTARRDIAQRRRAIARVAESDPAGLAGWALANDLWMRGDISAAYRQAQEVLRGDPTDFGMLLICLDYHIRARDSAQIYVFAERLIAAKNPAHHLRLMHAVESLFLWPLWLLGFRFGRSLNKHADNLDRWVSWARNYLANHPRGSSLATIRLAPTLRHQRYQPEKSKGVRVGKRHGRSCGSSFSPCNVTRALVDGLVQQELPLHGRSKPNREYLSQQPTRVTWSLVRLCG